MPTDVLSDYRANIIVIQELRWVGSGVMQNHDCDLYYNCYDSKHISGTGSIVNKRVSHMVIGLEPLGSDINKTSGQKPQMGALFQDRLAD
jgi:hypothetical protein